MALVSASGGCGGDANWRRGCRHDARRRTWWEESGQKELVGDKHEAKAVALHPVLGDGAAALVVTKQVVSENEGVPLQGQAQDELIIVAAGRREVHAVVQIRAKKLGL